MQARSPLRHQPGAGRERGPASGVGPASPSYRRSGPLSDQTPKATADRADRRKGFRHFRAWLGRQARGHRTDTIAILVLAFVGIVMMLGIFTEQKASLPSWLPLRRRRIRPHLGRVHDRAGGHPGPGPGGRHLRHPDRQGRLGQPRRRPRGGRDGDRAEVHEADPPGRPVPAAAENRAQRHDRRGRTGQRQGRGQGRPRVRPRADRTERQPRPVPRQPRRRHPPVHPAAGRRRRAGDRRPQPAARRRAAPLRAVRRIQRQAEQGDRRAAHRAGQGDPRLRRTDHRTRQARPAGPPLRQLLEQGARQLRQPAGGARSILRRVPGDPARRPGRARQLERILQGRAADADQADPAGAGLDPGLQGDREAVRQDDRTDPRRDPPADARNPARC